MRKSILVLFSILSAAMLLAVACGSDTPDPNATATTAAPNTVPASERTAEPATATVAPIAPTATPAPTDPSNGGGPTTLVIDVQGDALQFDQPRMSATAGEEITVNFTNSSSFNTHNWALVEAGTKDAVATDGLAAGQDNNWLPVDDPRVIGSTILIGPGESAEAIFTVPAAGTYQFVCTFPGHNPTMFGDFIVN